jgi:hypothetical protein
VVRPLAARGSVDELAQDVGVPGKLKKVKISDLYDEDIQGTT